MILLPAVGLAAWLGWADFVLWPALLGFSGLAVYALVTRPSKPAPEPKSKA